MTDLFQKPKSSLERIREYLLSRGSATNAELAELMRGTKGQLSWGQRVRDVRKELLAKGLDLECKEERVGIYRYTVVVRSKLSYEPKPH